MLFFISYETATGLHLAKEIQSIITELGHSAWVWEVDNQPGMYPVQQIAEQIEQCDVFLYVCTGPDQPERTSGQPYERSLAWSLGKRIQVIALDEFLVPLVLRAYTYRIINEENLHPRCLEMIQTFVTAPRWEEGNHDV